MQLFYPTPAMHSLKPLEHRKNSRRAWVTCYFFVQEPVSRQRTTSIDSFRERSRNTWKNSLNPFPSVPHNAPKYSSMTPASMPIPLNSTSLNQLKYSCPVLAYIAFCKPAASPRTNLPCASFGLKLGCVGMTQQRGENRFIIN